VGDHALAVRSAVAELRLDLGAVHDARVALRRLRAVLTVFEPVLDDVPDGLTRELRWFSRQVAGTRDVEVVAERLDAHLTLATDRSSVEIIEDRLSGWADEAGARASDTLAAPRTEALMVALGRLHLNAPTTPVIYQQIRTQQLALEALDDLCAGFPQVLADGPALSHRRRSHLLHARRKQAKTVRATTPILETSTDLRTKLNKVLRQLQNLLGEHHDAAVVRSWMADLATAEPSTADLVRDVRRAERAAMADLEARLPVAVDRLLAVTERVRRTPPVHLASP